MKDPRAQATGWTFATLAYNGGLANADPWRNLAPVGLMWGNDPQLTVGDTNPTPVLTIINTNLTQTVIKPSPDLPPQHLGWGSRLAGPADNPASSCASCHVTASGRTICPGSASPNTRRMASRTPPSCATAGGYPPSSTRRRRHDRDQ